MKTFTFTKLSVGEIELSSSERPRELVNFVTFSIFFFYFGNRVWLSLYEQALSGNDMQFFILPEIINWQYLSYSPFSRTHHLEAFLLNTSSLRSRRTKGRGYGRRKRIWAKKTEGWRRRCACYKSRFFCISAYCFTVIRLTELSVQ